MTYYGESHYEDSKHEIVKDVELRFNGVLHRFVNKGGAQYSAIYIDDYEEWSCEREHEAQMVREWNNRKTSPSHRKYRPKI